MLFRQRTKRKLPGLCVFPQPFHSHNGSGTVQKVDEHRYVLTKLYLQKQVVGQVYPIIYFDDS